MQNNHYFKMLKLNNYYVLHKITCKVCKITMMFLFLSNFHKSSAPFTVGCNRKIIKLSELKK